MGVLLKVLMFDEVRLVSHCKVVRSDIPDFYKGQTVRVDLTVNADFGEIPENQLVGKFVEVQRFQPCELIGIGCSIKEQP